MKAYSRAVAGLSIADHWVEVPLDHANADGRTIEVYAREIRATERERDDLPWLLFLAGGPGLSPPRPVARAGWLAEAVRDYRVLLLDQRGTGRSTPVTTRTPQTYADDAALATYLTHFRADAIVADAEALRRELSPDRPWTTLGQSYGGFCTFVYLSTAPQGLERCLVTGGVPPLGVAAQDVYRCTWPRVIARNREYHHRFSGDAAVLARIRDEIRTRPQTLPTGELLTLDRLRALGMAFGSSTGFAEVHYLLETAFDGGGLSDRFLADVAGRTSLAAQPMFALLQEAIYCEETASGWAAERTLSEFAELATDADPLLLTGETMLRAVFTDEAALRPWLGAAEVLHAKADWPRLVDPDVLAGNRVPVAAAMYVEDMYVDLDLSMAAIADMPHVRTWVTNEHDHDGLRADADVFVRVRDLATGRR